LLALAVPAGGLGEVEVEVEFMVCVRGPDVEDEVSGVLKILSFLENLTSARVRGLGSGIRMGKTTRISIERRSENKSAKSYKYRMKEMLCCYVILTHCDKDDQGEDREPVDTVIRLKFHLARS
jgi:hypothetical protein